MTVSSTIVLNDPSLVAEQVKNKVRFPSGYSGYTPCRKDAVGVSASDASYLSRSGHLVPTESRSWLNPQTVNGPEVVPLTNYGPERPSAMLPGYGGEKPGYKSTAGMTLGAYAAHVQDNGLHYSNDIPVALRMAAKAHEHAKMSKLDVDLSQKGYLPGTTLHVPCKAYHPGETFSKVSNQTLKGGDQGDHSESKRVDWVTASAYHVATHKPRFLPSYN